MFPARKRHGLFLGAATIEYALLPLLPALDRLRVVLVETRNPLNIGASARAMSNFGFSHLRVVNPFDAAFREARSAVGAAELLAAAESFDSIADAVAECPLVVGTTSLRDRDLHHPLRRLEYGARLIRRGLERVPWRCCSVRRNSACRTPTSAIATGSCAFPPSRACR